MGVMYPTLAFWALRVQKGAKNDYCLPFSVYCLDVDFLINSI